MTRLKPGDLVDLRFKVGKAVSPYSGDYDETRTLEIVAADTHGYYLYVPQYIALKDTVDVDDRDCKSLGIDKRYSGENVLYVSEGMICKVNTVLDGCACAHCGEFYFYAVPNQENGTLICFACRQNPYR
jgi:hypothetical protein